MKIEEVKFKSKDFPVSRNVKWNKFQHLDK